MTVSKAITLSIMIYKANYSPFPPPLTRLITYFILYLMIAPAQRRTVIIVTFYLFFRC